MRKKKGRHNQFGIVLEIKHKDLLREMKTSVEKEEGSLDNILLIDKKFINFFF